MYIDAIEYYHSTTVSPALQIRGGQRFSQGGRCARTVSGVVELSQLSVSLGEDLVQRRKHRGVQKLPLDGLLEALDGKYRSQTQAPIARHTPRLPRVLAVTRRPAFRESKCKMGIITPRVLGASFVQCLPNEAFHFLLLLQSSRCCSYAVAMQTGAAH